MLEKIIKRLDEAKSNMDNSNFLELYPKILDDLYYLLIDYKEDIEKLTLQEKFTKMEFVNKKIYAYYAKLAMCYFKFIHDLPIVIEETDEPYMATCRGGYDYNNDKIYYSSFGTIIAHKSDLTFLGTLLHEGRHKMQQRYYKFSNILDFPPYMLLNLKEHLFIDSFADPDFYIENYNILFYESDPELFIKNELSVFMKKMYELYQRLAAHENITISSSIISKFNEVNNCFNREFSKETFIINDDAIRELHGSKPIDSSYSFNNNSMDRLITLDLNLKRIVKKNPDILEKYPVLKLLFVGNKPKTYYDILTDKKELKANLSEEEKQHIEELYKAIIASDPVLTISELVANNDIQGIQEFIKLHPTVLDEYPEQLVGLNDLIENTTNRVV